MKIEYELTKQDYIDYNIFHSSYSKSARKILFIQRFIIPIIFLILPFAFSVITVVPFAIWMILFLIVAGLWIVTYPQRIKKIISRRISKLLDEGKNTGLLGKHSIEVTEEGIIDISESRESKSKWNVVENIAESDNHIYIYISTVMAYVIPKKAFKDELQMKEFITMVNSQVSKIGK